MGNNSVPKFIFRLSRFPVYRGSVLGRFYCIIILSTPRSSSLSFSLRYPYRNHVCTSAVPHTWHIQHKLFPQLTIQNPITKFSFKTPGKIYRLNISSHREAESVSWSWAQFMNFIRRKRTSFGTFRHAHFLNQALQLFFAVVKVNKGAPFVTHVTRKLLFKRDYRLGHVSP